MRLGDVVRHAIALGPRAAGYRAAWEAQNRTGLRQLLEPARAVPVPPDLPSFHDWSRDWSQDHLLRQLRERSRVTDRWELDEALMHRAERACHGSFVLFGHFAVDSGPPPDFTSEPITGKIWPDVHWSRVMRADVGDPRTTWELNRFGWVWEWIRASARRPEAQWGRALARHVAAWEEQNPFRVGINWVSDQELALRAIAWCAGAAVFGDTEGFGDDDFRRLWKLTYWHAFQIEAQLDFARLAVPNNHLLAEALALAIIADLAGSAPEAVAWRQRGLQLFREATRSQFREDGGYCQNSHRYHRYALELVLLADRWFPALRDVTAPVLAAGFDYFRAMVVAPSSGRVPNFGPNDGATAFRLSPCDDDDIRPLLATLAIRLGRPFPAGPWNEQADWLSLENGGRGLAPPEVGGRGFAPASFEASGVHVLRAELWTAFFRCGASTTRGGHADQLHVDVWRAGAGVAIDAGSARYFDDAHAWHIGTASHNTVTVDGHDQQRLLSRFTWADEAASRLVEFVDGEEDGGGGRAAGRSEAFVELGVLHERSVEVTEGGVRVTDRLTPLDTSRQPHTFRLHWLVPVAIDDVVIDRGSNCFTWNISAAAATFDIAVEPIDTSQVDATVELCAATHAPAYGAVAPATSIIAKARGFAVKFVTTIGWRE